MKESPRPIRILRIINRFNLGGPTFNVAYLTKYMDERFETKLVGGSKDDTEASSSFILEDLGIQPTVISEMKRSISPYADWKSYVQLKKIIKEYKPDIVHTHASKSGSLGRLAAIQCNVPVILHTFHGHVFHSYFGSLKTNFYKWIERWLARHSTRIIAISNLQKQELGHEHKIAPLDQIEIVPLGFDLSRFQTDQASKRNTFRNQYGLDEDHVAIGIIGRLVPIKNHRLFLNAVKQLSQKHPKARFFVIGDGEEREQLKDHCTEIDLDFTWQTSPTENSPLCFTSWIQEVDLVMAGLDIIALTSNNEGTPVSLIEAQAAGKAVVSTRVGGIEDIVAEGESALLCDRDDLQALVRHLSQLINHPEQRTMMGMKGKETVTERFSYARLVNDMERLYDSLLEEKSR